jgi:hypothetical protein
MAAVTTAASPASSTWFTSGASTASGERGRVVKLSAAGWVWPGFPYSVHGQL